MYPNNIFACEYVGQGKWNNPLAGQKFYVIDRFRYPISESSGGIASLLDLPIMMRWWPNKMSASATL
jgi:hypothetical protein